MATGEYNEQNLLSSNPINPSKVYI